MMNSKRELHLQVMKDLSLRFIQPLSPSSAWVYKVAEEDKLRSIKIADATDMLEIFEDVQKENEALQKTSEISGVVKLVSFYEKTYAGVPLRAIVRKYVKGKVLFDGRTHFQELKKNQQAMLESTVRALHKKGIASLDIMGRNVVLASSGVPYLIDFGTARLRDSCSDDLFQSHIRADFERLDGLFRRYRV